MMPSSNSAQDPATSPILEVSSIRAGYGKRVVLDDVSLSVFPGEVVAIIGANGAGKSTLLKVVAGLVRPTEGTITLLGRDVSKTPPHKRARAGLGFLMQGGAIFRSLSTRDHLELAHGWTRRDNYSSLHRFVEEDENAAFANKPVHAGLLSGGQRQLLAAATVLSTGPAVLLVDEPSAGLSPAAASEMVDRLYRTGKELGLGVLWVEQRVRQVLEVADRAILIREGSVFAETRSPSSWLSGDQLERITFGELA